MLQGAGSSRRAGWRGRATRRVVSGSAQEHSRATHSLPCPLSAPRMFRLTVALGVRHFFLPFASSRLGETLLAAVLATAVSPQLRPPQVTSAAAFPFGFNLPVNTTLEAASNCCGSATMPTCTVRGARGARYAPAPARALRARRALSLLPAASATAPPQTARRPTLWRRLTMTRRRRCVAAAAAAAAAAARARARTLGRRAAPRTCRRRAAAAHVRLLASSAPPRAGRHRDDDV